MKAIRHAMLRGALHAARGLALALLLLLAACHLPRAPLGPAPAAAQEYEEFVDVVPDSAFEAKPKIPVSYQTSYQYDQSRDAWLQSLGYNPSWKNLALGISGETSTTEDVLKFGSRSTNGDFFGRLDWRVKPRLVLSMSGRNSMSSISDGIQASTSNQRRNGLTFQSQYSAPPIKKVQLTVIGSTEFQRNYDLRLAERALTPKTGEPDSVAVQRDSSFASGRLDAVRGTLSWPFAKGFLLSGSAYGSQTKPITTVRRFRGTDPVAGDGGRIDSIDIRRVQLPADNAIIGGGLTVDRIRGTKVLLESKRTGTDQVYFDLGQLKVEQLSNDGRTHHLRVEVVPKPGIGFNGDAVLRRSLKEYVARPNLNALVTTRQASGMIFYSSAFSQAFLNFDVSRARAERQSTGNGNTITRVVTTNLQQRVFGRLYLMGLGSATLSSYRYTFVPDSTDRTFSKDDRDVASAFASVGARYAVTPRCSTTVNFSISRSHNVAIDSEQSSGNIATTVYQVNAALRLPLNRNLSIWQDYIATATDRAFDYDQDRDGLSRNFRIETSIADTLFPFAFVRLDHRYYFFDQGEFSPLEAGGGGARLYAPTTEQAQQALDGRIGIRPVQGITLIVKQSLTDTVNRDLVTGKQSETGQWNLSYGAEINRSFWNGAGLVGSIRREERYNTQSNVAGALGSENNWLVSIQFQKDF